MGDLADLNAREGEKELDFIAMRLSTALATFNEFPTVRCVRRTQPCRHTEHVPLWQQRTGGSPKHCKHMLSMLIALRAGTRRARSLVPVTLLAPSLVPHSHRDSPPGSWNALTHCSRQGSCQRGRHVTSLY